jgi:hypothetical protein
VVAVVTFWYIQVFGRYERVPILFLVGWVGTEALGLGFLAWWLRRLTRPLRRHLRYVVSRDWVFRIMAAGLAAVVILSTVGMATPGDVGRVTRSLAVAVGLAARLLVFVSARRLRRAPTG